MELTGNPPPPAFSAYHKALEAFPQPLYYYFFHIITLLTAYHIFGEMACLMAHLSARILGSVTFGPKNPGYLLQGIRGFPLKKRIKMKRTVSCKFYNTGKILTNPTSNVTKGLNHPKAVCGETEFLEFLNIAGTWIKEERPTERPVSLLKNGG